MTYIPSEILVSAGLFPFGDVRLGNCFDWQDFFFGQGLAVEIVGDQLGRAVAGPSWDLDAGAVLLARLDGGNTLFEAVAADHDELALLDPERNACRFRGLQDAGS